MSNVGVVVIGRNEGERLVRCLKSLLCQLPTDNLLAVYVDSGSTDHSVDHARALINHVLELDMSIPFTMARGRNAGFSYLLDINPDLEFVQFVDGDCELLPGWLEQGLTALQQSSDRAIVCGRRRERFPQASVYNRLADMEWNTPVGEAAACGGDFIARCRAIQQVNGFNPSLICGEEPEMCIRLRQLGWKIQRIDVDMTLHDAAITRFSQWWKRSIRGGWYVAEGRAMYGNSPIAYQVREEKSGWLWGLIVPLLAFGLALPTRGLSGLLLLGYGVLIWKIYRYRRQVYRDSRADARLYAYFCALSKVPQMIGQSRYYLSRWFNRQPALIEYKAIDQPGKLSYPHL
ncbi:MAG: glycosyltransferase family 2 protein [Nodosilinea sp.]